MRKINVFINCKIFSSAFCHHTFCVHFFSSHIKKLFSFVRRHTASTHKKKWFYYEEAVMSFFQVQLIITNFFCSNAIINQFQYFLYKYKMWLIHWQFNQQKWNYYQYILWKIQCVCSTLFFVWGSRHFGEFGSKCWISI